MQRSSKKKTFIAELILKSDDPNIKREVLPKNVIGTCEVVITDIGKVGNAWQLNQLKERILDTFIHLDYRPKPGKKVRKTNATKRKHGSKRNA